MEGFTRFEVTKLRQIEKLMRGRHTYKTDEVKHGLREYWEKDSILNQIAESRSRFNSDCEEYAMVVMRVVRGYGFNARLVACLDETGAGHLICEVLSTDGKQSYFIDNRKLELATRRSLKGYKFHSVSPVNPIPGEKRPWFRVTL